MTQWMTSTIQAVGITIESHRDNIEGAEMPPLLYITVLCVRVNDSAYSFVLLTVIVRSYVITKRGVIKKSTFSQAIKVNLDLSLSLSKKISQDIKSPIRFSHTQKISPGT